MIKLTHGSLFSGIGGFDLAAEWMGWENKFHCEWNEFGQKVLNHYWPNAESFTDITKTDFTKYANKIDILTGGFPCQPYSSAGKRKGKEDERHLWPQMLRAIREVSPRFVVGENVRGLLNWNGGVVFEEVHSDMESQGYEVQAVVIPAAAVNAPHGRDRVWFVAYNNNNKLYGSKNGQSVEQRNERDTQRPDQASESSRCAKQDATSTTNAYSDGFNNCNLNNEKQPSKARINAQRNSKQIYTNFENFPTKPPICSGNDGLSSGLDGITFPKWRNESIKAYGNAIVPQVAYQIFKAIEKTLYL